MNDLTVIIPFLNEGIEVEKTVRNLRKTGGQSFDLLLINDASTDGFDYRSVAERYGARYLEHSTRMGVAASRDEGIALIETDAFLLLDGHMRVWQTDWVSRIMEEVRRDPRAIYCCQTIPLTSSMETELSLRLWYHGATINWEDLSIFWRSAEESTADPLEEVPAVLGASYAALKSYWQYLLGLSGLRSFGYDEQLISMKCWLEGGACRLIKDVRFAHRFRTHEEVPYHAPVLDYYFNQIFIAQLLLPEADVQRIFTNLRDFCDAELFETLMIELSMVMRDIRKQQRHYRSIFTRPVRWLETLQRSAGKAGPYPEAA